MKTITLILLLFPNLLFSQEDLFIKVDSIFQAWEHEDSPGGVVGIIQNEKLVFHKGYGYANIEHNVKNSVETKFFIGSISKQFTAACIIRLIEKDSISFDNSLLDFFTGFPAYAKEIKIKHLLNHTSGLREYFNLFYYKNRTNYWADEYSNEAVMSLLKRQSQLNFEPGAQFSYSNTNYILLAMIVEKVSGKSIQKFAKDEIFNPLGMKNTAFKSDYNDMFKNRAFPYQKSEEGVYELFEHMHSQVGDGGIITTVQDFTSWNNAYFKNGQPFSDKFWELMCQVNVLNNGDSSLYASGISIFDYQGIKMISHGGAIAGYQAQWLYFPTEKTAVIIFTNFNSGDPYFKGYEVANLVLKDKFNPKNLTTNQDDSYERNTIKLNNDQMKKFEGTYLCPLKNGSIKINLENDTLFYQGFSKPWALLPISENQLVFATGVPDTFNFSYDSNELLEFDWNELMPDGNIQKIHGTKLQETRITPEQLKEYAGTYYSPELNTHYLFKVENGELEFYANSKLMTNWTIIGKDYFFEEGTLFRFTRNANQQVIGFDLIESPFPGIGFIKM